MSHFLASTTWQPWPPISRSASKHTSFPQVAMHPVSRKKTFFKKPRKKLRSLPSQFHLGKGEGGREKEKWFFFVFLAVVFFRGKENLSFRQRRKRERTQTTLLLLLSCFPYIFSNSSLPPPSRRDGSEIYIFLRNWRHTFWGAAGEGEGGEYLASKIGPFPPLKVFFWGGNGGVEREGKSPDAFQTCKEEEGRRKRKTFFPNSAGVLRNSEFSPRRNRIKACSEKPPPPARVHPDTRHKLFHKVAFWSRIHFTSSM